MRQRILETAGRLFAERGYAATSVRDIADELGIANPSLYHHFSSKAELLEEVLREPLDLVMQALVDAEALSGEARTRRIVEGLVDAVTLHGGVAASAVRPAATGADAKHVLVDAGRPDVSAVLADGVTEDRRELRITMAMGAVEGAVRWLASGDAKGGDATPSPEATRDDVVDLVLRLLPGPP